MPIVASMSLLQNALPGATILQAKLSGPMRDCRDLRVIFLLDRQVWIVCLNCISLSCGSFIIIFIVYQEMSDLWMGLWFFLLLLGPPNLDKYFEKWIECCYIFQSVVCLQTRNHQGIVRYLGFARYSGLSSAMLLQIFPYCTTD